MIVVSNRGELLKLIEQRIEEQGPNCDLNDIDVSRVTDMYCLFEGSKFSGNVSAWNTSNVERMDYMFMETPQEGMEPSWWRVDD